MKFVFTCLLFLNIFFASFAQTRLPFIKGKVSNAEGRPLEFASLYPKNTDKGTTTNEMGEYAIQLPKGKYEMVFQYVGYRTKTVEVILDDEDILLDVVLENQSLTLKDIVVEATDQDPAYAIIRKAQEKRKFYLKEEVKSYQCSAYTKGLQRLSKKPKSLMGVKINADTGVVYFSESFSELSYQQPDKYKEKMISSKVSGNSQGFSFNQASGSWLNLYENISGEGMTERGLVSPIAANAMAYYRYRLEGYYYENGNLINKIKIIPKRKTAPAYAGYLYIIEDTWRIHSADLYLPKGTVEFVDSARVQQVYTPIKDKDVWLPLSQKINFEVKVFGFEASGYFIFVFSNYTVEPAFEKKHFNNEVFVVEKDANKRDTAYWNRIRPVPLSAVEMKDYIFKDSLQTVKESKTYKDSVDRKRNKLSIGSFLWAGYNFRNSYRGLTFSFSPIISTIQYNTVEGMVIDFPLELRRFDEETRKSWTLTPSFRYGFVNERFQAKLSGNYNFKPLKGKSIQASGGKYVEQISRIESIKPFWNTTYTLYNEQNFLKLYEKTFGNIGYGQEIVKGIRFFSSLEYAQRRPLQNTAAYKWKDIKDREFTSNVPVNNELNPTEFVEHEALTWNLGLRFNFGQKYAIYPNRRFITESKYPTVRMSYRKGVNLFGSDVDYDLIVAGVEDEMYFGVVGEGRFEVEAGAFLNSSKMTFIDFRHFGGNQTIFLAENSDFQLLDYYQYSTNESYIRGHYEHHFNGFFLNSIPFIKRLKWQEVITANYLYTPQSKHYLELGFGIEHIFKFLRVDFFTAIQEGKKLNTGFRFGFGF